MHQMTQAEDRTTANLQRYILLNAINSVLFAFDLMRLNCGDNTDEYACEANAIVRLLKPSSTCSDTLDMVYQVFIDFFDETLIPKKPIFVPVSQAIWALWQQHIQQTIKT